MTRPEAPQNPQAEKLMRWVTSWPVLVSGMALSTRSGPNGES